MPGPKSGPSIKIVTNIDFDMDVVAPSIGFKKHHKSRQRQRRSFGKRTSSRDLIGGGGGQRGFFWLF